MRCKVFSIRLEGGCVRSDEAVLNNFLGAVKVRQVRTSVINGDTALWSVLVFYENKSDESKNLSQREEVVLTPPEKSLYENLRRWRNEQATKEGLPPYIIAHNLWLKKMVKMRARTKENLLQIKGFGEKRIKKYGDELLKVLQPQSP